MYRTKRKLPAEQKRMIEETLQGIRRLFRGGDWLVCLDRVSHDERSMLHGIGPNPYGRVDRFAQVIYVDFRHDVLAMFIHQCLHAIHPNMIELDVQILELVTVQNLESGEARELLKIMVDHSMYGLPDSPSPHINTLMLNIEYLFTGKQWLVMLEPLKGYTDLSAIYDDLGRSTYGLADTNLRIITVDFREALLSTFIHECLHAIDPDMNEQEVRRLQAHVMDTIDSPQAEWLVRLMLRHAV